MTRYDLRKNMSSYIGDMVFKYLPQGMTRDKPFLGALYYMLIDIDDALYEMGEYYYHYVNGNVSDRRIAPIYSTTYLCRVCVFITDLDVWTGELST